MRDIGIRSSLKFLRRLNAEFPGDVPLHLIMDNYGTHKHAKVKAWLKRNPRFVPHFVPTSSSWLNLVERWFGHLDNKAIRRGVFLQRRRPAGVHRGVSQGLEPESQTLRVDRDRRIHPGKAHPLSPNPGADQARLHQPQVQKAEMMNCLVYFTDTKEPSAVSGDPSQLRQNMSLQTHALWSV